MPLLLSAGLIVLFGSTVQGAIGFAFGLIAIPLLLTTGFTLAQAVALTTIAIGIQGLTGTLQMRQHIPWPEVRLALLFRYMAQPLGVLILVSVEMLDTDHVRRIVGIMLLVSIAIRLLAQTRSIQHIPMPVSIGMFALSGFLQGMISMGGPPVVLWMTAKDFTSQQARAFTQTLSLFGAPVQIVLLILLAHSITPTILLLSFLLAPVMILGLSVGIQIGNRFSKPVLNVLALGVLVVIAVNAIF